MSITLEMVQEAYKAIIRGKGKPIRSDYFGHAGVAECCGLSAIYLQKHGGILGATNHGLSHLSGALLEQLEEEPDEAIPNYIMQEFKVSRSYVDGWVMGFDNAHEDAMRNTIKRLKVIYQNAETDYMEGHADGKKVGDVIFAVEEEPSPEFGEAKPLGFDLLDEFGLDADKKD